MNKPVLLVNIDDCLAIELLESETVCYRQGLGGDLSVVMLGIRERFPELAAQYHFLPWKDYEKLVIKRNVTQ